ncbi:2-acyl-glycerophospho-ethanolamine acyltransferase [Legionella donaldsonii]|uniref:2-acyl-glycerophospho-ethanolamine acyltransferase n=1 Tax=Legionella donaldsonii TaxID=45060 RepID=A0A378J7P6_9GAMM|nr:lysophospholipid acyltransferase family protein [Legionella donaldsonii]STX40550.1 2-acyl-glycerophospho-ethanolamine acyltransferase [Legionella donaldsonii]
MNNLLRFLFFQFFVRPIIGILLGLNVRHRERLPIKGPAILVANHNSHLDTMVLMTLFSWRLQKNIYPVAAADYFLKNKLLAWFSQHIIGIIPIQRKTKAGKNPFALIQTALDHDKIIIFYPEGSRGEPEKMSEIKRGIAHLAKNNPTVPIYPIFMYGLGKALPKDESLLVPFVIDVVIGTPVLWPGDATELLDTIKSHFEKQKQELVINEWN